MLMTVRYGLMYVYYLSCRHIKKVLKMLVLCTVNGGEEVFKVHFLCNGKARNLV